ncbi:MAG: GntR family transcriptional regulator [Oscillospiraceae bacterium]|nr:GntR family transcriptional regulator [Oscillospiraceae bacterium]
MFTMRLQGGTPIYEQLRERITELIISGEMKEGEKLPAVREIAKQLTINPNTVQKTYAELERQGLIYSVPAKGSYVSPRANYIGTLSKQTSEEFSDAVKTALSKGLSKEELVKIINDVSSEQG